MSNPTKSNGNVYQRIANQNTFTENYKINGNFFTINGENLPYTNVYSLTIAEFTV
jgi:hypothetical protein